GESAERLGSSTCPYLCSDAFSDAICPDSQARELSQRELRSHAHRVELSPKILAVRPSPQILGIGCRLKMAASTLSQNCNSILQYMLTRVIAPKNLLYRTDRDPGRHEFEGETK